MTHLNTLEESAYSHDNEVSKDFDPFLVKSQPVRCISEDVIKDSQVPIQVHSCGEHNFEPIPFQPQPSSQKLVVSKPRKNLSPYNYFFKEERERLLAALPVRKTGKPRKSHGKIGFQEMARIIAQRWREVDPWRLEELKQRAAADKERYVKEMKAYKKNRSVATPATVDPSVRALAQELDRDEIDFLISALQWRKLTVNCLECIAVFHLYFRVTYKFRTTWYYSHRESSKGDSHLLTVMFSEPPRGHWRRILAVMRDQEDIEIGR